MYLITWGKEYFTCMMQVNHRFYIICFIHRPFSSIRSINYLIVVSGYIKSVVKYSLTVYQKKNNNNNSTNKYTTIV